MILPQIDMNIVDICGPSQSKRTGFFYTNLSPKVAETKGIQVIREDDKGDNNVGSAKSAAKKTFLFFKWPLHSQEAFHLCRLHMLAW